MKEYVENMKEYVKNMKEYVTNMKEYEPIYWIWHSHIYMGLGTWKNSEFSPFVWALALGKISIFIPTSTYLYGDRLWDLKKF